MHSLQELFIQSRGNAIKINDQTIIQADRIPISRGTIQVKLLTPPDASQGVCLNAKGGCIELSDGSFVQRLHIWHEPGLPHHVNHHVDCPTNELLVWNIYRTKHRTGEITVDCWTGDAGMIAEQQSPTHRLYSCSDWRPPFNPSALKFEVEWEEE
jgi:hypothetical protein